MNDWKVWAKGLAAAVIGGVATALLGVQIGNDWRPLARVALVAAVMNGAAYLKQSPVAK